MATVSNVLRGTKAASSDVEARVREAVAALGYAADRAASQLRSGQNRVVAALVPSLDNPFFTGLIAVLERCARAANYDIVIASGGDDDETERARLTALLAWRPAGVIVLPRTDAFVTRDLVARAELPFVIVDRLASSPRADLIAADNYEAGAAAVRHLAKLGHRRVLVVATSRTLANIRERSDGARGAAKALGLRAPQILEVGLSFESAIAALGSWLGKHPPPTGVVALTNFSTLAMLACLREHGLDVPKDVSLVGFDDYAWMRAVSPPVTAIRQPVERMGEQAWACLLERMEGGGGKPRELRLPCTLEVRRSTRNIGGKDAP